MRRILSLALLIVLGTGSASATTLDVPASYATIAAGLAAAASGDTVLVACGTYNESNLTMKSGVILRSATGLSDCATINAGAGSYRVMTCTGLASGTIIEGFTLTGGRGSSGAGVSCTDSPMQFKSCKFLSNTSTGMGGGVYLSGSTPGFSGCIFQSNTGTQGGGAYIAGGAPTFTECDFTTNAATSSTNGGGGVYCTGTTASFSHCTWTSNTAPVSGAMYVASAITLHGCSFTSNSATAGYAGAVRFYNAGTVHADSCFFTTNTSSVSGAALDVDGTTLTLSRSQASGNSTPQSGAIYCRNSSNVTATDCEFSDNTSTGTNSCGGALYSNTAVITLERCIFNQNHIGNGSSNQGGALFLTSAGVCSADSCTFYHNEGGRGGAVTILGGTSPSFTNCNFSTNAATYSVGYGGGLYFSSGVPSTFANCTMDHNSAPKGGGIYLDSPTTMTDCTISYNQATGTEGGGCALTTSAAASVVTGCTFDHNTANGGGGGVSGNAMFSGCAFVSNTASSGGAANCGASSFEDCQVLNNSALSAGGIYASGAVALNRCTFGGNAATSTGTGNGGGVRLTSGAAVVDSCNFSGNTAGTSGGGLHVGGGTPSITYCTIELNSAVSSGGGLYMGVGTVTSCFIEQNTTSATGTGGGVYCAGGTITDCQILGNSAKTAGGIYMSSPIAMTGCTIEGNAATNGNGGGVQLAASSQLNGCTVSQNTATATGGGIYVASAGPTLTGCTISGNTAGTGGGGAYGGAFTNCTFRKNHVSSGSGGGLHTAGVQPSITTCSFTLNAASSSGGGVYIPESTSNLTLSNLTFFGNSAGQSGGGLYFYSFYYRLTLTQSTFCRNSATYGSAIAAYLLTMSKTILAFGNGVAVESSYTYPSWTITCCDVYGNKGGDWVNYLASHFPSGNNLEIDPEFCDRYTGDLHLAATSPCLNAPSCEQVGALGQGCDEPRVRSWRVPSVVPTVQAGVDSAWAGDTVLVERGFAGGAVTIAKSGISLFGDALGPDSASTGDITVQYAKDTAVRMLTASKATWRDQSTGTLGDCIFVRNPGLSSAAVISVVNGSLAVDHVTVAYNEGHAFGLGGTPHNLTITNSVIAFNEYPSFEEEYAPSISCTDIYGNLGGDWIGAIEGQGTLNGNMSADPQFCDPSGLNFHLAAASPCLSAPGCGRVGALGEGCAEAASLRTWHVPADVPTIASALTSAWMGETVLVAPGTYHEQNLDLGSWMNLRSESGNPDVVIDADNAAAGLTCTGRRYSTIKGLWITDASAGGKGLDCSYSDTVSIQDCIFVENHGIGLYMDGGTGVHVERCTSAFNGSYGVYLGNDTPLDGVVVAFNDGAAAACQYLATPSLTCCDLYGNAGGDWTECIADQAGVNGNISANPAFCQPWSGDLHLAAGSPCLNAAGCERMGAYDQGCDEPLAGRVWEVPLDVPTIRAAIDSSMAGDTVSVSCGTYAEYDLPLKSEVVLRSAMGAADCATIDAGYLGRVISVTNAKHAKIEGLTLTRGAMPLGAGLHCQGALDLEVEGCVFYGNQGSQGAGLFCDAGSTASLAGCSFAWNVASEAGGGIWTQAPITVSNSIIAFSESGEAVACDGLGSATFACSDVFGNAGGDWVGCINGQLGADGNMAADPRFCRLTQGDLHLAAGSPCLSALGCGLVGALGPGCETQTLPRVWHVPSEVPTIQAAIDSSAAGDTVLVACGTYTWSGEGTGDANGLLRMMNHITLRSETGQPDCVTIDAEHLGRILYCNNLTSTATAIEGFTMTGGSSSSGGGLYHRNDVTRVRNCRIDDNVYGPGVYIQESATVYENCEFTNHSSGAISTYDSPPFVTPGPQFSYCTFFGNQYTAVLRGFCGKFSHCLMYGNLGSSVLYFDDVYPYPASTMQNTIVAFNTSASAVTCTQNTVTLSCSDLYGNATDYSSCISDQQYLRGNMRVDPEFCDRLGGDFHLGTLSPCLNAACGVMGPYGEGECGLGITAVRDIVLDQGGQVRVRWRRAYLDAGGMTPVVTSYALWRRIDDQSAKPGGTKLDLASPSPDIPVDLASLPPGQWDCVTTVPAMQMDAYSVVSPTLCDSTPADGMCWSRFCVTAHTSTPSVYYTSRPDSGYSVDNLVPSPPTDLRFESPGVLAWDPCPDPDFDYFTVYGSAQASLGDSAVVLAYTSNPTQSVAGHLHAYYHVTATDFSGNEGPAATIVGTNPAGLPGDGLPRAFALYASAPNPFSSSTVIRFDLPAARAVRLDVYGIDGRLVCRLVDAKIPAGSHRVQWRGIDDHGRPVASGVYFCRLVAGDFSCTKRVVRAR